MGTLARDEPVIPRVIFLTHPGPTRDTWMIAKPAFASGSLTVWDPVRLAFALALYGGFLSPLSQP